ncbi:MAG: hypothetical protein GY768_30395 [Planctomycetaceae bacterium]|nr:hypothetical protein [Planctomycetaceae bacterium]
MLWLVLIEFVFRLAFGLAAAMTFTSAKSVTSGFFRVHLWVALGLNTFVAAAVALTSSQTPNASWILAISIAAAIASYVGSIFWLYEMKQAGWVALLAVTLLDFSGGCLVASWGAESGSPLWTNVINTLSSGLVLGFTFSAMLLGHWYLNTPSMKMAPLQRLIGLMVIAVVFRAVVSLGGLVGSWSPDRFQSQAFLAFVGLRWLAGLLGLVALAWMSWETLKIPNTQSATGILYVAVIFAFLGELTSQLLSVQTPFPL